jgi:hypothetical protein
MYSVHVCVHVNVCVYICVICIYVCVCVFIDVSEQRLEQTIAGSTGIYPRIGMCVCNDMLTTKYTILFLSLSLSLFLSLSLTHTHTHTYPAPQLKHATRTSDSFSPKGAFSRHTSHTCGVSGRACHRISARLCVRG